MYPVDTLTQIALDRHREQTRLAHRTGDGGSSSRRLRVAAGLRRAADRLDSSLREPESPLPLAGRGS